MDPSVFRGLIWGACCSLVVACAPAPASQVAGEFGATPHSYAADSGAVPDAGRPPTTTLLPFTQLVLLGDSNAGAYKIAPQDGHSWLLRENDDGRFPEFAGRDLKTQYADIERIDLSEPGAASEETIKRLVLLGGNRTGRTLVILSWGIPEYIPHALALADQNVLALVMAQRNGNLARVAQFFADRKRYPYGAVIGHLSTIDPTDGLGSLPPNVAAVMGYACGVYAEFVRLGLLRVHNELNEAAARVAGMIGLDIHTLFLGHGQRYNEPSGPFYDVQDPALWMTDEDCVHPNELGHQQIRRLVWNKLVVPNCSAPSCLPVP